LNTRSVTEAGQRKVIVHITCPYCNAVLDHQQVESAGPRVRCPRCGDTFPNRWMNEAATSAAASQTPPPPDQVRRSNRTAALVVVGIMLASAAVGLFYALRTAPERQSRHPDPTKIFAVRDYRPADLPALGYLPFDTRIAAGIHVADLLRDPLGNKLLEKPRWQGFDWVLDRIAQWTDLTPEAIDHIAVGINAPGEELPGLAVVVQTRQPYRSSVLKNKYANRAPDYFYERPLFRIQVQIGDGYLWCADDRTLVMLVRFEGVQRADLDRIPFKAHAGMEGLPDELQTLITDRLPPQPVAWAVGELEEITERLQHLPIAPLAGKSLAMGTDVRSFALGVQLQKEAVLYGAFEGKDLTAAYAIQNALQRQPGAAIKVVGLPPAGVLATTCLGMSAGPGLLTTPAFLTHTWVIVQARVNELLPSDRRSQ
jgi:predicted Zn finger-like uncharacterized protein